MPALTGLVQRWPAPADFAAKATQVLDKPHAGCTTNTDAAQSFALYAQAAAVPAELPLFAVEARIAPPTLCLPPETHPAALSSQPQLEAGAEGVFFFSELCSQICFEATNVPSLVSKTERCVSCSAEWHRSSRVPTLCLCSPSVTEDLKSKIRCTEQARVKAHPQPMP